MSLEELKLDLDELKKLQHEATRSRTKQILATELDRLQREIMELEKKQTAPMEIDAAQPPKPTPTRFVSELQNYAWDQSDKFMKIFVSLDGVQDIETPDENVQMDLTNRSLDLHVRNLKSKDYVFKVKNLLNEIQIEGSFRKVKTDTIGIYLKKKQEGKKWDCLTTTAKHLKEMKESAMKPEFDKDDPSSGIMGMLKHMYETGDPEMKKMIAKSWQESEEKRRKGEFGGEGL